MKKERSRMEIISDILKVTREEKKAKKTRIMRRANLDWVNFQRYLDFLIEKGFIAKSNPDSEYYEITENGKNLSDKLKETNEILG